jgi:hypothetical protein
MIREEPVFHLKRAAGQIFQRLLNRRRDSKHTQRQTKSWLEQAAGPFGLLQ